MLTPIADIDIRDVSKELNDLTEVAPVAASYSLNRSIRSGKSFASKRVRETYLISKTDLDKTMSVSPSSPRQLIARIIVKARHLALTKFVAVQNAYGTFVQVKVGGGGQITHAFIQTMKSKHKGVFLRKGKKRLPIQEMYAIGPVEMISSVKVNEDIREHLIDEFVKNFLAYIKFKGLK